MAGQQRPTNEPIGSQSGARTGGPGIGTLLFVTACGVGLGLLTAPQPGRQTRRRLRKRLATIGGEVADRWGEVQDRLDDVREAGTRAGRRVRQSVRDRFNQIQDDAESKWSTAEARIAELEERVERMTAGQLDEEEEGGGLLTATLGIAAGAGLAYFLMADSAAPARSKVQRMASDVRQQATDRWQQFRRGGVGTRATADATTMGDVDEA